MQVLLLVAVVNLNGVSMRLWIKKRLFLIIKNGTGSKFIRYNGIVVTLKFELV